MLAFCKCLAGTRGNLWWKGAAMGSQKVHSKFNVSQRVVSARLFCVDSKEVRPASTMLSEAEAALQESVAKFAKEIVKPKVAEMDEKCKMDPDVIKQCFEQGLMGICGPEEFGGVGLGLTAMCVAVEEIAAVDPVLAILVDIHGTLVVPSIAIYGNREQKERYLPRLCSDTISSFCLSEAGSGSDAFALKTRADWDAGTKQWVINGTKCWISNSSEAGLFMVFANADPSLGYRGITAFLVPRDTPGLSVGKKEDKMGLRASSTCEVIFDGVKVGPEAVLGKVGEGYRMAIVFMLLKAGLAVMLNEGRIGVAAQMVGLARGAFDAAMQYIHQRQQFGKVIADFQGMQFQYARAAMEMEAARTLVYNAARLQENGKPFASEAAMAKLLASETAQRVASQSIDWMGGVGYTRSYPVEKFFRDSKIGTIYEGTSNMQLATIAKAIQARYK